MSEAATSTQNKHHTAARIDGPHGDAWPARATAAILDLMQRTSQAEDLSAACRTQANELQRFLGCERVAVGLRRRGKGRCRVVAVSGMADLDLGSDLIRDYEADMDAAILDVGAIRGPIRRLSLRESGDPFAERKATIRPADASSLNIPLRAHDGTIVGAWSCFGGSESLAGETNGRFLDAAAPALADTLKLVQKAHGGLVRRALRGIGRSVPKFRGRTMVTAVALVAAGLCIPVPYDINVQCELQPDVRRFVAAPYAGEFQKSLVKPGDTVAAGQVLARMDGREVRWDLAAAIAEHERACKSRDVNMAEGKTAAAQIDQLEIRRQQVKQQLLERRLANLEIKSPIDGIVVAGDLQRSEGVTVSVGQVLYEVAPLNRLTAELAITDEEISRVAADMPATLRLDSQPQRQWRGSIERIHPRAVTREKDNVFIAEVAVDNSDAALRPGMKGRAVVRSSSRSLAWVLFHKPWNFVTSWLDW